MVLALITDVESIVGTQSGLMGESGIGYHMGCPSYVPVVGNITCTLLLALRNEVLTSSPLLSTHL